MADAAAPKLEINASRHLARWLAERNLSFAFTTYQANKLFLVGGGDGVKLSVFERTIERPMGLALSDDAKTLYLASQYQIYRFDDVLRGGASGPHGSDRLYAPHQSWITGDLDVHDLGLGAADEPFFVATRFSCIGQASPGYSFRPHWKPEFISKLAAEDRCHLNGMAMEDGAPRYATAVSRSDSADGWRDHRISGGLLIDVTDDSIVAEGLSMPHSPRLHDGTIYLLNAGTGEFGRIEDGAFVPLTFCPGFARGLSIEGGVAAIGLSLPREEKTFGGLPLQDSLEEKNTQPRCGILFVDIANGDILHTLRIEGVVSELFDVAFLAGCSRPSAIGFKSDEVLHVISIDDR